MRRILRIELECRQLFFHTKTEVTLTAWSVAAMKASITSSRTARGTDGTDVKSWDGAALMDSQHLSFKEAAAQPSHVRRLSRQAQPSLLSPGAMGRACRSPGESSGLAALFHASPKDTRPTEAAPRSTLFLRRELLFILECLLAHFPIFRSLNAFSSLALTPLQDYLQSLAAASMSEQGSARFVSSHAKWVSFGSGGSKAPSVLALCLLPLPSATLKFSWLSIPSCDGLPSLL